MSSIFYIKLQNNPGLVPEQKHLHGRHFPARTQPGNVTTGIRVIFCLFPVFVLLLNYIPFRRYDLTAEKFEEIKRSIRRGR